MPRDGHDVRVRARLKRAALVIGRGRRRPSRRGRPTLERQLDTAEPLDVRFGEAIARTRPARASCAAGRFLRKSSRSSPCGVRQTPATALVPSKPRPFAGVGRRQKRPALARPTVSRRAPLCAIRSAWRALGASADDRRRRRVPAFMVRAQSPVSAERRRASCARISARNVPQRMRHALDEYVRWLHQNERPAARLCQAGVPTWVVHAEKGDGGLTDNERSTLDGVPARARCDHPGARILPSERGTRPDRGHHPRGDQRSRLTATTPRARLVAFTAERPHSYSHLGAPNAKTPALAGVLGVEQHADLSRTRQRRARSSGVGPSRHAGSPCQLQRGRRC